MENDKTQIITKALLIGLDTGEYNAEESLEELAELAATAGAEVSGKMLQKRDAPDAATCIGAGRLAEAALFVQNTGTELVIFDLELTGSQISNIEDAVEVRVIDRTMLILDIFAQRAQSSEGRVQVELAQQRYLLPRLTGKGEAMSRLGGGIGTRGPGESKLESDRRHIRRRIASLERELEEISARRGLLRARRKKDNVTTVAIVGYTNVGKSTLLNALTNAGVLAQDMLFATLDPTSRALSLPDGRTVMLIDTVGLIQRLPHQLVEAFRSTLEEAAHADLILNVCDISSGEMLEQKEVAEELMRDLGAEQIPILTVLNKCDRVSMAPTPIDDNTCLISAKTGFGIDELLRKTAKALEAIHTRMKLLIPYSEGPLIAQIRAKGKVFSEEFCEKGTLLDALVERTLLKKAAPYRITEEKN